MDRPTRPAVSANAPAGDHSRGAAALFGESVGDAGAEAAAAGDGDAGAAGAGACPSPASRRRPASLGRSAPGSEPTGAAARTVREHLLVSLARRRDECGGVV